MSHGLYQVWVELFRGRECTTFGFILVHFLYRKWNRKTDTPKWNNDVPKQSKTWYNHCTKKERTGIPYICVPICAQDWPTSGRKPVQGMVHFWKKKAWHDAQNDRQRSHILEGSRKGTYFLGQAAQNLTVQSKVCAKNFLVNNVYRKVPIFWRLVYRLKPAWLRGFRRNLIAFSAKGSGKQKGHK